MRLQRYSEPILCKMDDGNWKQKQIVTKDSKSFVACTVAERKTGIAFFPSLSHCIILQNKNNRVKILKKVKMPIKGKCFFTSSTFFGND